MAGDEPDTGTKGTEVRGTESLPHTKTSMTTAARPPDQTGSPDLRGTKPIAVEQPQPSEVKEVEPPVYPAFQILRFEYTGKEQIPTQEKNGTNVYLTYDRKACRLTCNFRVHWKFPRLWKPEDRESYIKEAITSIQSAWNSKYKLVETLGSRNGAKPLCKSVTVELEFTIEVTPQEPPGMTETQYTDWFSKLPDDVHERLARALRFRINEKDPLRANYIGVFNVVNLGPNSAVLRGKHVTIQHEFGHVLGLADEYPLQGDDYANIESFKGKDYADEQKRRRPKTTEFLMNSGQKLRPDYYRPFAVWLSNMTGETWRVEGDKGK